MVVGGGYAAAAATDVYHMAQHRELDVICGRRQQ